MAGDFRFSTSEAGYYGPDFRLYPERWWDDPVRPTGWPDISVSSALLTQIDQVEPLGKKSCRLTSSLNALIVRGLLEPADAERINSKSLQVKILRDTGYLPITRRTEASQRIHIILPSYSAEPLIPESG